ncbi:hypothetical protein WJX84_005547 [Apatococcus fuscideae]|uniref:N-acetyltransferase domain-containing protein n=1 Tax=Apatococcus fuscideae TaxID=2026836 RepID=A0AAW1SPR6_9CHLO
MHPPQSPAVQYETLLEKHLDDVKTLHSAIFPVRYQARFFRDSLLVGPLNQVALVSQQVVGCIISRIEEGGKLHILTLGVLAPYRGGGIGSTLLQRTLTQASQTLQEAFLLVHTSNTEALRFYQSRFGFQAGECKPLAGYSLNKLLLHRAAPLSAVLPAARRRVQTVVMATASGHKNVLGGELKKCGDSVGFYRNGYCMVGPEDGGNHSVSAIVTDEFLAFTKGQGNDLSTPRPGFPGLKAGDRWCLCAGRWKEAEREGHAPKVDLEATDEAALRSVDLELLKKYAGN